MHLLIHLWWIALVIMIVILLILWRRQQFAERLKNAGKIGKAIDRIIKW